MKDRLEKLADAGIQILPAFELTTHYVLEREGFFALVERRPDGSFGAIGAPGFLSTQGPAQLVWRGSDAFFVAKGFEQAAAPAEVESLRRFGADLQAALA